MTVKELRKLLKAFPKDMEVLITDGHAARCYRGNFVVEHFNDVDGVPYCDIGIGGCLEDEE